MKTHTLPCLHSCCLHLKETERAWIPLYTHSKLSWTWPKPGAGNSITMSHVGGRYTHTRIMHTHGHTQAPGYTCLKPQHVFLHLWDPTSEVGALDLDLTSQVECPTCMTGQSSHQGKGVYVHRTAGRPNAWPAERAQATPSIGPPTAPLLRGHAWSQCGLTPPPQPKTQPGS